MSHLCEPTTALGRLIPWLAVVLGLLGAALDPTPIATWHLLVFLAFLLIFGIPHGAIDHLVMARLIARRLLSPASLGLIIAYIVVGGGVVALWCLAPGWTFLAFLLVTIYHWGQGELWLLRQSSPGLLRSNAVQGLALVLRGGIPILVPLLAWPEAFAQVTEAVVGLFGQSAHTTFALVHSAIPAGWVLLLSTIALYAVWTGVGVRRWRPWLLDIAELASLVTFFTLTPPVLAIGLYLCLWHAPRHILRLTHFMADRPPLHWRQVRTVALASLPMTLGAALTFAVVWWLLRQGMLDPLTLMAGALAGVAALTAPHVCVVAWMDHRDQIWTLLPSQHSPPPSS
ncbi:MAG: Brp/Blh family beta-carotene 15,15'-dioxygenase [Myxococcota bacterium]